jgi:hypothetical protein
MSDAAFKGAPYGSYTTEELKGFIAEATGLRKATMVAEVERRAKRDAGDVSVMTDGERLAQRTK